MSKQANGGYSRVYTNGFDMGGDPFAGRYQRNASYQSQKQNAQKPSENLDITQNIELNVNDIFLAGTKGITVNDFRKCPYCNGNSKTFCSQTKKPALIQFPSPSGFSSKDKTVFVLGSI